MLCLALSWSLPTISSTISQSISHPSNHRFTVGSHVFTDLLEVLFGNIDLWWLMKFYGGVLTSVWAVKKTWKCIKEWGTPFAIRERACIVVLEPKVFLKTIFWRFWWVELEHLDQVAGGLGGLLFLHILRFWCLLSTGLCAIQLFYYVEAVAI